MCVRTYVVRPSTKSFIDFNDIWHVGRGRWMMHDGMQCDPIQGQGHKPLKFGNSAVYKSCLLCHIQWEIESVICSPCRLQMALGCTPLHRLQCSAPWGYWQAMSHDTDSCVYTYSVVSFFLSAMRYASRRPSPFSLNIPHKNPVIIGVRTIPAITSILDTLILDSDRYWYSIRVVKRFSKIRLSKFFIVLVFDLQKSNIVSNTVLCNCTNL